MNISVLILLFVASASAHFDSAYFRNPDDGFTEKKQWMADVAGHTFLSQIAIPGTHDSGADGVAFGNDAVATQCLNMNDQLRYGIRFFDIRTRHFRNSLPIHHGPVFQDKYFDHILDSIQRFLDENPSEVVLFRLKHESEAEENTRSYRETVDSYLANYDKFLQTTNKEITLNEVRGRFIIFPDNDELSGLGIPYDDIVKQDNYNLGTNWDLYQKWVDIRDFLYRSKDGAQETFFMNYLSGSGGSFPYFVASGHSSPGTSDSRLSTGLTTPGFSDSYPEFPRTTCFIGICTISFEGTNILTRDKLKVFNEDKQPRTVGIIMADFPGEDLILEIVRNNFNLRRN